MNIKKSFIILQFFFALNSWAQSMTNLSVGTVFTPKATLFFPANVGIMSLKNYSDDISEDYSDNSTLSDKRVDALSRKILAYHYGHKLCSINFTAETYDRELSQDITLFNVEIVPASGEALAAGQAVLGLIGILSFKTKNNTVINFKCAEFAALKNRRWSSHPEHVYAKPLLMDDFNSIISNYFYINYARPTEM